MIRCLRCGRPTTNFDAESGLHIHRDCLTEWWAEFNAPRTPEVEAETVPDDDDPNLLRRRGVLT